MAKIWVVKNDKVFDSKSLSDDEKNAIEKHNCVIHPESFRALTDFSIANSYHQRCLKVKSRCVAGMGYDIQNGKAKQTAAFIENQNDLDETFSQKLVNFWYDYELYGNAKLEIARVGKKPHRIHFISSQDIYITQKRDKYWQLMPDSAEQAFAIYGAKNAPDLHELIGLREYTPKSGYYGLPGYLGALNAITANHLIAEYNINFFANSAIPDLMLIVEGGEFDEKTEIEVQAFLQNNIKGIANSHKTLYIPVSDPNVHVRIEKLNEAKDGQFRFLRNDNRDEILSVHGVPPRLAGVVVSGSLGGASEAIGQLQTFLEIDVRPKQRQLESFLNKFFENEFKEEPQIKLREMDITSALDDANMYNIYLNNDVLESDEVREKAGFGARPQTTDKQDKILKTLRGIRKNLEAGNE